MVTNANGDHETEQKKQVFISICKNYKYGSYNDGNSCKYSHPPKCLNYCRYGKEGCNEGYKKCNKLHPVLCRNSLNHGHCFDEKCTLAHLKGTKRFPSLDQGVANSGEHRSNGSGKPGYSKFDSKFLGFRSYRQQGRSRPQTNYAGSQSQNPGHNSAENNAFTYDPVDFPIPQSNPSKNQDDPCSNVNSNLMRNESFLELMKSVREIQEAQKFFNQEIISLKAQAQTQKQMTQGFYHPQSQVIQTRSNVGMQVM